MFGSVHTGAKVPFSVYVAIHFAGRVQSSMKVITNRKTFTLCYCHFMRYVKEKGNAYADKFSICIILLHISGYMNISDINFWSFNNYVN